MSDPADESRGAGEERPGRLEWQGDLAPGQEPRLPPEAGEAGGARGAEEAAPAPSPEAAADRAALDAFMLALRVMLHTFAIEGPGTEYEKPWALLRQIAEGELTLMSPAEVGARHPGLRDFVYEYANQLVQHDREVANRVLRGLGKAL